ncbi:bifunctional riboflavin kinase/FAD synthetase [Altericista sp. CCNU0014]|uniref:bifunctional riboflavin kinase/FAD synthetase n=1 Tax=Altericista sp. CCNU0014 TaxID=3082949 RepID=UPI00384C356C
MWVTSSIETSLQPTHVALGNFDGVHLGHHAVIRALSSTPKTQEPEDRKRFLQVSSEPHCYSTVVSFTPHPHVFFSGQPKPLLTLLPEKVQLLEALGVEQLVLLPFDRDLANLTPEAFVEQVLVRQLKAQKISVGFNFCFGRERAGNAEDLRAIAARYDIPVAIVEPAVMDRDRISSSAVRQALETGDVARAKQLLGRAYTLTGIVMQGQQLGRTLGFPTANLDVSVEKFIPHRGVYQVRVESSAFAQSQLGVMNIGARPTVSGTHQTIEIHILDWSGDLYGHTVTVHLEQFLRFEQKFESLDALKAQIRLDCTIARQSVSPID